MRLPDNARGRLELALRSGALAALAWLLWGAFRPAAQPAGRVSEDPERLRQTLAAWAAAPPAETLHVAVRGGLPADLREALRALRGAGTRVAWSDDGVAPLAIEGEAVADPAGGATVRVAGAAGSVVALEDGLGVLDSFDLDGGGAAGRFALAAGSLSATVGTTRATVANPAPAERRAVAVFGAAGWETRFVIAALEERGWGVDARLDVAPGIAVTQGRPLPLDRGRHGVVVVFDSLKAVRPGAVSGWVERGGGLVLVGRSAARSLAGLAPGRVTGTLRPASLGAAASLSASEAEPVALYRDGLSLSVRDTAVTVAARRYGAGRVIYVGYRDTWRWRLEGLAGAEEHRAWWAGIVAAAAPSPRPEFPVPPTASTRDAAPRAALSMALGPAVDLPPAGSRSASWMVWVLLGLALAALMAEWLSRRLRGLG